MPALSLSGRRIAVAVCLAALATLALAAPASAHITVGADDAHQGAPDSLLTFRVPNEEATATTVKVTIAFPTKTPIASVKPAPKPGWTLSTKTTKFDPPITTDDGTLTEGVSQVVYTAKTPADGIPVGGFDAFQILVGPLPDKVASLAFPTVQTYSDGKSVSWVEPVTDPANEPELPAPTLDLEPAAVGAASAATATASPGASSAPSVSVSASSAATETSPEAASPTTGDVDTARNLGIAGVVVGGLGLLTGAVGTLRGRRPRS